MKKLLMLENNYQSFETWKTLYIWKKYKIYGSSHNTKVLLKIFYLDIEKAGKNTGCHNLLELEEEWIEEWFYTKPEERKSE